MKVSRKAHHNEFFNCAYLISHQWDKVWFLIQINDKVDVISGAKKILVIIFKQKKTYILKEVVENRIHSIEKVRLWKICHSPLHVNEYNFDLT